MCARVKPCVSALMTPGVTMGEREPDTSSGVTQPSDHSSGPVLRLAEDPTPLPAGPPGRRADPQPPHLRLRELRSKDQLHFSEQGLPPSSLHPRFLPLQHHHRSDCAAQRRVILGCFFSFFCEREEFRIRCLGSTCDICGKSIGRGC